MKQSKFEVDRMKDENDRFFAFLKVVEKENKDDQIFKQGFDSLLKEGAFLVINYFLRSRKYKPETGTNATITTLSNATGKIQKRSRA